MAEDLHIGLGKHLRQFIISWDGQEAAEAVNEVALAQAAIEYLSTRSAVSAERPGREDIFHTVKRAIQNEVAAGDYGKLLGVHQAATVAADDILALFAHPAPVKADITADGPHEIGTHRRWLARQLLDSNLSDAEAYGIVRHHPDCAVPATPEGPKEQGSSRSQPVPSPKSDTDDVHVFLDCDGVLADFDTYAHAYFGMPPREYEKKVGSDRFWRELEAKGDFYRNLPLMADAKALYDGVKHLNPTILTGCPRGNWAEAQKVAWAQEHFPGVPIITCRSSDKRAHAKPGDVLIDDWAQHRHRWIEMGGVFITHHCAETSLAALWAHYPALRAQETPDAS